jgi:hypothetical protein
MYSCIIWEVFKLLKSDSATATRLPAQMLAFDHAWHSTCWSGVCATEPSLGTVNVNGDSVGLFVVFSTKCYWDLSFPMQQMILPNYLCLLPLPRIVGESCLTSMFTWWIVKGKGTTSTKLAHCRHQSSQQTEVLEHENQLQFSAT